MEPYACGNRKKVPNEMLTFFSHTTNIFFTTNPLLSFSPFINMFKRLAQRQFVRYNSHGHGLGVSKHIKEPAFPRVDKKAGEEFKKAYEEKVHHSVGVTQLWKKITYIVAVPALILAAVPVINIEMKHAKHREHLRHIPDEEWPVQYDYQNIRQKKFFWGDGDKTLFWNSDVNRHIE